MNYKFPENYDYQELSQTTRVKKYCYDNPVKEIKTVILSSDSNKCVLEVIFSDEPNVVYEVLDMDDFQEKLIDLINCSEDNIP